MLGTKPHRQGWRSEAIWMDRHASFSLTLQPEDNFGANRDLIEDLSQVLGDLP